MSTDSGGRSLRPSRSQPAIAPLEELGEVLPQALLQGAQGILESRLLGLAEPHFPLGELDHELDPLAPAQRGATAGLELAETGSEVAREALLPDPVTLEEPGDDREDLARVDRLDEVVGDLGAQGVLEGLGLLALRHHDHGHGLVHGPDGAEELEPTPAGHLLIEQDDAIGLALEHDEGIVTMGTGVDGESLFLEEHDVRGEGLDLVVDPEDGAGAGHGGKLNVNGKR